MNEPLFLDHPTAHLALVMIPDRAPIVVMGDKEDFVADYVVEIIRRHYGDDLIDSAWLTAHPYPRSRTGQSTSWLDWLLEVSDNDPDVLRVGPAPLIRASIRRPDVVPETEYQPYPNVFIRRSMFTDGELIGYRVWNRTDTVSDRFTTHDAYRQFLARLAIELGPPRPEQWEPTHLMWQRDPDDQP